MALAYWLMGTVFIARQAFDTALDLLCEGRAAQDAQPKSTAGFPAVGLHLLTALALAAVGKVEEAIESLTRELESPHRGQLYARECISNTWYTLGALRHRQGKRAAAAAAFTQALTVVPGHPCAAAAPGISAEHTKRASLTRLAPRDPNTPQDPNTIDAAIAQAIGLVRAGRHPDAARVCGDALNHAPSGLAGWLLPAEPMLNPTGRHEIWADTLRILSNREKAELRDTLLARLQTISQTARVMIADTPGIDHQFQLPEVMSEEVMLTAGRRFARDAERFLGAFIAHGLPGTLTSDLNATVDAFERASRVKGMSRDERVAARTNMKAALSAGISAVRRLHVIVMNHLTNDEATRTVWDRDRRVVYPERKRAAASRATAPESNPAAATPAAAVTASRMSRQGEPR